MIRLVILLCIFFSTFSSAQQYFKQNINGSGVLIGNGIFMFYPSAGGGHVKYELNSSAYKLTLEDGSYFYIDAKTGYIERYSILNHQVERYKFDSINISNWEISNHSKEVLNSFRAFLEAPNGFYNNEGNCFDHQEVAILCREKDLQIIQRNIFGTANDDQCAYERNQNYFGYNGHQTLDDCTLTTQTAIMTFAGSSAVFCAIYRDINGCVTSVLATLLAFQQHHETKFQCKRAKEEKQQALTQCEINADRPDTGGDSGIGHGGGFESGVGGSVGGGPRGTCYEQISHSVCTGGGCNYWREFIERGC